MSFWDNVKKFAQPYSDEDYEEYEEEDEYEEEAQETAPRSRRSNPFSSAAPEAEPATPAAAPSTGFSGHVMNMSSGKQEVVLFHAKTFDDAAKAADELRKRRAVIFIVSAGGNIKGAPRFQHGARPVVGIIDT